MTSKRRIIQVYKHETTSSRSVVPLTSDKTTTVRLHSGRPVTVLELGSNAGFQPDSPLPLPDSGVSAVLVCATVFAVLTERPAFHVLVAGHGADGTLAEQRARAVQALLLGQPSVWAEIAAGHGSVRDLQTYLAWVAQRTEIDCDPGTVDGIDGPKTRGGLDRFRAAHGLPGGAVGVGDWVALFSYLDDALAELVEEEPGQLAAQRAALHALSDGVGCGDAWPRERVRILDHAPTHAERVDVLLFAASDVPKLSCHGDAGCEWTRCDVYRKNKYRKLPLAEEHDLQRRLAFLEIEDVSFNLESAVLMPSALEAPNEREQVEGGAVGLQAIETVLRFAQRFPNKRLLVTGHADRSGTNAFNQPLSHERAENVLAYVRGDRARWVELCEARHTPEDLQQILTFAASSQGWETDPGGVDGKFWGDSQAALERFRERYQAEGLPARGAQLPSPPPEGEFCATDWEVVFELYERELAKLLNASADTLYLWRGRIAFLEPAAVGCSEHFPARHWHARLTGVAAPPAPDGQRNQADRRVELLLFDDDEEPDLSRCHGSETCNPEACELYQGNDYLPEPMAPTGAPLLEFILELRSGVDTPIPEVPYVAALPNGEEVSGLLDLEGRLVLVNPPAGEIEVRYPDPDDVVAKADAGRARRALETADLEGLLDALDHGEALGDRLIDAYARYFNTLSGEGLEVDVYATFTEFADRVLLGSHLDSIGIPLRPHDTAPAVPGDEEASVDEDEADDHSLQAVSP